MKFIVKGAAAVMLLLGSTTAYQKRDQIANELSSLSNMIDEMEQPQAESIFSRVLERKDQIATLSETHPEFSERYTSELDHLSNMIDAIEDEDFDVCMQMIEERKDSLMTELTLSLFESPVESTQNMIDIKAPNLANPKEAEAAHKKYLEALVKFYEALPATKDAPGAYQVTMMTKAKELVKTWEAYEKKVGKEVAKKANYKSPSLFKEFYAKSEKAYTDAVAAKKKYEEE